MSQVSIYVTLAVICGCALITYSAPALEHSKESTVELSEALGKSVCPIKMEIDDDPNRIPRRIKMLKCAKTPNPACQQENMTHACCRHHHHNFVTQCMEVVDHVLVQFRDKANPEIYPVSVGCSCMITKATHAQDDS